MQAKESKNSRAQDEVAEENKADQKALHYMFPSKSQEFACSQCSLCRSNCTKGFLIDQPEILMQQSTNINNLIESPDFSEVMLYTRFHIFTSSKISRDLRTPVEFAHALWCRPWVQLADLAMYFCSCKAL